MEEDLFWAGGACAGAAGRGGARMPVERPPPPVCRRGILKEGVGFVFVRKGESGC